jgi:hypothetical protein
MITLRSLSPRLLVLALLTLSVAATFGQPLRADASNSVTIRGTGSILVQALCSATEMCQEAVVSGQASHIGRFSAILVDRINILDGTFTSVGLLSTPDGSTIETEAVGQSFPVETGDIGFVETHIIVGGTGRFAEAEGSLLIAGTADPAGQLRIAGKGAISR